MEVAEMPEQLTEWGCDDALWKRMPPGARRDLTRFALSGNEDLGRGRIATMKEIAEIAYEMEPSATWERATWEKAVAALVERFDIEQFSDSSAK